jgi:error-prone DNA polymerase
VPVPVYERHRLAIRAEPLVIADGRLERRDGVTNVVVSSVRRLERPDLPLGEVRHIEPRRTWSTEEDTPSALPAAAGVADEAGRTGGERLARRRAVAGATASDDLAADLRAVAPHAHSFGRRG